MLGLRLNLAGCAILISLLAAIPASAGATPPGGEVIPRSTSGSVAATPGDGVSLVFRLTNTSRQQLRVRPRITYPTGWRLVTPETSFGMSAGARELRIVRLSVPSDAAPGRYWIVLTAFPERAPVPLLVDSIAVDVREYRRIDVALVEAPQRSAAGSPYSATFAVRNSGNVAGAVGLRVASSDDLPAFLDSAVVHLGPGASRSVRVVVRTEGAKTRHVFHRLELRAGIVGDDSLPAVTASGLVELIPRVAEPASRFHRLPVDVAVRRIDVNGGSLGGASAALYTAEVRARGTLTEGGSTQLDVLLRGPQPEPLVAFGERDEIRASLRSPHLDLHLGDQAVALSPLTENGRSGFGAGGRITTGRVMVGGFALRNRWGTVLDDDLHRGGFVNVRLTDASTVGVTYLSRGGIDPGSLWAARSVLAPISGTRVELEYGAGTNQAGRSTAHALSLTGAYARLGYAVQHLGTGIDYPGSARGTDFGSASAWLRLWRQLVIRGQLSDHTRRFPLLTDTVADRQQRAEGGIAYGSVLAAEYARTARGGSMLLRPLDGLEEVLRVRATIRLGVFSFGGIAERGRVEESRSTTSWRPFEHDGVQAVLSPGTRMSYAATVDHFSGSSVYTPWAQDRLAATFNATLRLNGDATRVRLFASGVRDRVGPARTFGTLDAAVEQRLPLGHEVSARVRLRAWAGIGALDQSVAEVTYRVHFGVPVSRSRTSARIVGRVYDVETGRGVANALVRVGGRAILTDGAGRLVLTGIRPAAQYVELDRGSIGLDRVPTQDNPLPVPTTPGGTAQLELGVIRSAHVSGRVELFDATAQGASGAVIPTTLVGGLQGAIITLSRGSEAYRRLTDDGGRFRFDDLRPGRWTLRVEQALLPPDHYLEQEVFDLEIAPGENVALTARVLPRKRVIRIITEGELTAKPGDAVATARLRRAGDDTRTAARPDSSTRRAESAAEPTARTTRAPSGTIRHRYTVSRWEMGLPSVAGFVYGDTALWPKLWVANRDQLRSPGTLRPGQRLIVPDAAPLTAREIAARDAYVARRRAEAARHRYTVTRWDTDLMAIAKFIYGDASLWPKIWVANRRRLKSPTALRPGQRLLIPDEAPLTSEEIAARDAYLARRRR